MRDRVYSSRSDWKNERVFSSQGKVGEFYSKYWNNPKSYTGKVWEICQPVTVKALLIWYHTLNEIELVKILENCEKSGKFVIKSGNHVDCDDMLTDLLLHSFTISNWFTHDWGCFEFSH